MRRKGPWSQPEVDGFLAETGIPIRLACNGASGHPVLVSLWFVHRDGKLWCATQNASRVAKLLRRDPRCAFEVATESQPYHGVRGQGMATFHDDQGESVLRSLIDRYLPDPDSEFAHWLLARAKSETAIAIEPETLFSWDYRERMGSA